MFGDTLGALRLINWMFDPAHRKVCVDNDDLGAFLSFAEEGCAVAIGLGETAEEALDEATMDAWEQAKQARLFNGPPAASLIYFFGGGVSMGDIDTALQGYAKAVSDSHRLWWGYSDSCAPVSFLLHYYSRMINDGKYDDMLSRMWGWRVTEEQRRGGWYAGSLLAVPTGEKKKWEEVKREGVAVLLFCGR